MIIFVRGPSGTGKTTLASEIAQKIGAVVVEADQFFTHGGQYKFNPKLIGAAHEWARKKFVKAVGAGENVVVSNTATRRSEVTQYTKMLPEKTSIVIVDLHRSGVRSQYKNQHGLQEEKVQQQSDRFEAFSDRVQVHGNEIPLPCGPMSFSDGECYEVTL